MAQESAVSSTSPERLAVTDSLAGIEASRPRRALFESLARKAVLRRLSSLEVGEIELVEGDRVLHLGCVTDACPLRSQLQVHDRRFWERVAFGGSIGAAEAYAEGLWSSNDLTALVRILARSQELNDGVESGLARVSAPLHCVIHRGRSNSRRGSLRNIAAHYDLGNEFFRVFLDPTMMYSSAVFPSPESSLEEASLHKLDLICRKLQLSPDDEVVEIGSGWGGFAVHAARNYGCRVLTTTISRRQFEYTRQAVREAGLEGRVAVVKEDYRDLLRAAGRKFDKLVSIEMIEAVGHGHLPLYFEVLSRMLKDDGMGLLQVIVIPDQRYESYRRSVDFIQRHIFPGGLLPSVSRIMECIRSHTDLRLQHLEDITPHYARTLACWRQRFLAHRDRLAEQGFDQVFQRLWQFYFSYCEGGFLERTIGDVQMLLTKPLNRREPIASEV